MQETHPQPLHLKEIQEEQAVLPPLVAIEGAEAEAEQALLDLMVMQHLLLEAMVQIQA